MLAGPSRGSRLAGALPRGSQYLHLTQQGVVTGVGGEVLLKDRHGARQGHVPAATEQGDPREAEDGGHQRGVGDPSQTLDAAFKAAWTQRREKAAVTGETCLSSSTPALRREGSPLPAPLSCCAIKLSTPRASSVAVLGSHSGGDDPGAPRGERGLIYSG